MACLETGEYTYGIIMFVCLCLDIFIHLQSSQISIKLLCIAMLKSLGLRFLGTGKYTEAGITSGKPASDENITFHCHKSTPDISTADMCY
jgi:hypothetical protein